jgi:hypothetical protein
MNVKFTYNSTEIFLEPTTLKGHDLLQKLSQIIPECRWIKKGKYGLMGISTSKNKNTQKGLITK